MVSNWEGSRSTNETILSPGRGGGLAKEDLKGSWCLQFSLKNKWNSKLPENIKLPLFGAERQNLLVFKPLVVVVGRLILIPLWGTELGPDPLGSRMRNK